MDAYHEDVSNDHELLLVLPLVGPMIASSMSHLKHSSSCLANCPLVSSICCRIMAIPPRQFQHEHLPETLLLPRPSESDRDAARGVIVIRCYSTSCSRPEHSPRRGIEDALRGDALHIIRHYPLRCITISRLKLSLPDEAQWLSVNNPAPYPSLVSPCLAGRRLTPAAMDQENNCLTTELLAVGPVSQSLS